MGVVIIIIVMLGYIFNYAWLLGLNEKIDDLIYQLNNREDKKRK